MSTMGETLFEALHNLYQQLLKAAVEELGSGGSEDGGEKMGLAYLLFKTLGKFFLYGFKDPMNDLRARVSFQLVARTGSLRMCDRTEFLPRIDTKLHPSPRFTTLPYLIQHYNICIHIESSPTAHKAHLRIWEILSESTGDGSYDIQRDGGGRG